MIWCWKNAANIREGIGIGNEFLKIASQVEPLIGSGDMLSYLGLHRLCYRVNKDP